LALVEQDQQEETQGTQAFLHLSHQQVAVQVALTWVAVAT
jgi:hypothetical protein